MDEEETNWLEPSDVGSEFMRHSQAMDLCGQLPVRKSFSLGAGYSLNMLRKMAEGFRPKKIAVIEHGELGFEVRRLANNDDVAQFYKSIEKTAIKEDEENNVEKSIEVVQYENIKKVVRDLFKQDIDKIVIYDQRALEYRNKSCISHAFISRKTSALSCFRNDTIETAKAIVRAISKLEEEGVLEKLSKSEISRLFDTTSQLYKIDKTALNKAA